MTPPEILEQIRIYLDLYVDETNIGKLVQYIDVVTAIDLLEKEVNRREFESNLHG